MTPMMKAPCNVPPMLPSPPASVVPPSTTAAMASSSNPTPAVGCAEFRRAVRMTAVARRPGGAKRGRPAPGADNSPGGPPPAAPPPRPPPDAPQQGAPRREQARDDRSRDRQHRTHAQVDAAGEDDKSHAGGDNRVDGNLPRDVEQVAHGEKRLTQEREDDDEQREGDDDPEPPQNTPQARQGELSQRRQAAPVRLHGAPAQPPTP